MRRPLALRQKRAVQRAHRRHADDVYRYALAVLGDPGYAEEIVRRTLLKAYLRRRRGTRTRLDLNALLGIAHDVCRRRAGAPSEPAGEPAGVLICERAELALSRALDDRLSRHELRFLSVHLSVCGECEEFGRGLRRQRAMFRALAAMPVPESLQLASSSKWWRFDTMPDRKFLAVRASS
jgi:DNA-directed RNA polymerase specialized sigma24 family protein